MNPMGYISPKKWDLPVLEHRVVFGTLRTPQRRSAICELHPELTGNPRNSSVFVCSYGGHLGVTTDCKSYYTLNCVISVLVPGEGPFQ